MRKIVILFMTSLIFMITGSCVFAFELGEIERIETNLGTQRSKEVLTLDEGTKTVLINDICMYSGEMFYVSIEEDDSLKPNEVVIDYNDSFNFKKNQSASDKCAKEITFYADEHMPTMEHSSISSFDDCINIWKTKKMNVVNYGSEYFSVYIRHGSDVQVIDQGTDEYAHYLNHLSKQHDNESNEELNKHHE